MGVTGAPVVERATWMEHGDGSSTEAANATTCSQSFDEDSISISIGTDDHTQEDDLLSDYEDDEQLASMDSPTRLAHEHRHMKQEIPQMRTEMKALRRENSKLKTQLVKHRDLVREINKELAGAHTTVLGIKKQKEMLENQLRDLWHRTCCVIVASLKAAGSFATSQASSPSLCNTCLRFRFQPSCSWPPTAIGADSQAAEATNSKKRVSYQ